MPIRPVISMSMPVSSRASRIGGFGEGLAGFEAAT